MYLKLYILVPYILNYILYIYHNTVLYLSICCARHYKARTWTASSCAAAGAACWPAWRPTSRRCAQR